MIRPPTGRRPKSDAWPLGDPVIRLKNHLIVRGVWSEERHKQAEAEVLDTVIAAQKEAESHGTLHAGGKPSVARHVRGCLCARCRRICAGSASRRESEPCRARP